jgi:hypothetical protein
LVDNEWVVGAEGSGLRGSIGLQHRLGAGNCHTMGDLNQLLFIQKHAGCLCGPFLEVGSKDYGSTQNLRSVFAGRDIYVGVDCENGTGVDVVLDLTDDFDAVDTKLGGYRFGAIFCLSVLEHCAQPFKMAENLTRLLTPHGKICISVPFSWKFHGYPSDYWRFTQEGVKQLFPRLEFDPSRMTAASARDHEFHQVDEEIGQISFSSKHHWRQGRPLRGVSARLLRALAHLGVWSWLCGYRYVLAPTNILMIGALKNA